MRLSFDRVARAAALAALVASAAPAGCREPGDGGFAAQPIEYEAFCDSYAQMACDAAEACDCLGGFGIEACLAYLGAECREEYESKVESGRSAFHADEAGRCVAALRRIVADCTVGDDEEWPESCDRVLTGLGGEGAPCESDVECAEPRECLDERCVSMPGEGEPCLDGWACGAACFCGDDGLCRHKRRRGGPCPEGDLACEDDLYCDGRTTTCEPYLSEGEACAHASYACDDDLYCSDESGTCRAYPGAGASCVDSGRTCADDLYCDESDATCRIQGSAGAPCAEDEQCLSYECVEGACERDDDDDICPF